MLLVLLNQMASGLFRLIGAVGRNMIIANTFGSFALLLLFALGGVVLSRGIEEKLKIKFIYTHLIHSHVIYSIIFSFCSLLAGAAVEIKKWWIWGYWSSPLMYAQSAILVNEFRGNSWSKVSPYSRIYMCFLRHFL